METDNWKRELETWLGGFAWVWFSTLTFRPGFNERQARWRLHLFLDQLRQELGTPDFGWLAVREMGRTGGNLHFHVLVMGILRQDASTRVEWMRRWNKLGGDAQISNFQRNAGGLDYILKDVRPDDADSLTFDFPSRTQLQRNPDPK